MKIPGTAYHSIMPEAGQRWNALKYDGKVFLLPKRFLVRCKRGQQRTAGRDNPAIGLIQFLGDRVVRLGRRGNGDLRSGRPSESFNLVGQGIRVVVSPQLEGSAKSQRSDQR